MGSEHSDNPASAFAVAIAAWLVPGLGYVLLGQRVRGVTIGVTIFAIFAAGVLVGGIRVLDAPWPVGKGGLLEKPWFMGQVLTGPMSLVGSFASNNVPVERTSHSRSWELGTLYTAVAGMLNLLAIIDAAARAADAEDEHSHALQSTGGGSA
jgi:hypothetical protein